VLGPTPLDPRERAVEWQLAALVLALFANAGGVVAGEESVARPVAPGARRTAPARRSTAAGRVVRPPRSC
jgi:hypothetical protein